LVAVGAGHVVEALHRLCLGIQKVVQTFLYTKPKPHKPAARKPKKVGRKKRAIDDRK
jgi:hypothetical protein